MDASVKIPYAPTGSRITGTLETLSGNANISGVWKNPDGSLELKYTGDTEILWDEQKTVERDGQAVYIDENGEEWLESQLVLRDEEDE